MNWNQWKQGLGVALLSGLFQALIGFSVGITWKQALVLFAVNVGTVGSSYLKSHPVDFQNDNNNPPSKP